MADLTDILRALAGQEGVRSVLVVSEDGLPVEQAGEAGADAEELAALVSGYVRDGSLLAAAARMDEAQRLVIEAAGGFLLMGLVRAGHWLLVLAEMDADIGTLLYEIRRHHPSLAAQL